MDILPLCAVCADDLMLDFFHGILIYILRAYLMFIKFFLCIIPHAVRRLICVGFSPHLPFLVRFSPLIYSCYCKLTCIRYLMILEKGLIDINAPFLHWFGDIWKVLFCWSCGHAQHSLLAAYIKGFILRASYAVLTLIVYHISRFKSDIRNLYPVISLDLL